LNSKCRRDENVDLTRFNFLEIASRNFSPFGKLILCQTSANPFAADIRAKGFDSHPFLFGQRHGTLRRVCVWLLNDTYIVKEIGILLVTRRLLGSLDLVAPRVQR